MNKRIKLAIAVAMLSMLTIVGAQTKATTHKVNPESALKIRDAQVKAMSLQSQIAELTNQRDAQINTMKTAVAEAYATAKLSQSEYDIDDQKWEFVKKASATPAPETKPEPVKEEPKK